MKTLQAADIEQIDDTPTVAPGSPEEPIILLSRWSVARLFQGVAHVDIAYGYRRQPQGLRRREPTRETNSKGSCEPAFASAPANALAPLQPTAASGIISPWQNIVTPPV